ncbi:hypothetical protein [Salinibacterium sp. ZJ454]|uniref:hypothetical protein n=1 Tax=Salinibacterium sp. ZJ454 TaxID=2708339 RepID=UPI0014204E51|nr:hypothetical protein [Salinibacterium sp. ZJ454]
MFATAFIVGSAWASWAPAAGFAAPAVVVVSAFIIGGAAWTMRALHLEAEAFAELVNEEEENR